MSEQLDQFMRSVEADAATRREVREHLIGELIAVGAKHGYTFTNDDVHAFFANGSIIRILEHARASRSDS